METKIKELEESKIQLSVEVTKDELKPELADAYKQVAKKYTIPGFRKGKIPAHIIDLRIGKEVVIDEMLSSALPKFYMKAVDESKIFPVSRPKIEIVDVSDEKLVFNADILVKPEITLGDYKGVEVSMPKIEAPKDEIDQRLDVLRERFSNLQPVEREVNSGDFALVDYEVFKNADKLEEMSISDYMMEIDERKLAKEMYDVLIGTKPGEKREVKVTLPPQHSNPELAGQEVDVKLQVKEVKEKTLPEPSDDFAKESSEFDTIKELREDIGNNIIKQKEDMRKALLPEKALEVVAANADYNLPQEMVDEEASRLKNEFQSSLDQRGLKVEDYLKLTGSNEEKIKEDMEKEARRLISNELILDAVAEREDIKVDKEDIDKEVEKMAVAAGQAVGTYYKELEKHGRLFNIIGDIRLRKALNLITDNTKVKDEVEVAEKKEPKVKKPKVSSEKKNIENIKAGEEK